MARAQKLLLFATLVLSGLFFYALTYADYEMSTSSVRGLWHFNGTSTDSTDNAFVGSSTDITFATSGVCKLGSGCVFFNGSTSLIEAGDNLDPGSGNFSMTAWIKPTFVLGESSRIVDKRGAGGEGYGWYVAGSAKSEGFGIQKNTWTPGFSSVTSTDQTWHHAAVTVDRSGYATLYLNGSSTLQISIGNESQNINSTVPFTIGRLGSYSGDYYSGYIDELIWTNNVLDATTISNLYNNGSGQEVCLVPGCNLPTSFFAEIQNTDAGVLRLRSASSTSASILKELPEGWVVYVASSTGPQGQAMIADGYRWVRVIDKTDHVIGWMAASSTSKTYLSYTSSSQAVFETKASSTLSTEDQRIAKIVEAVDWYWSHVSSTDSLYNTGFSYLFSTTSSASSTWMFPKELFFAMASQEDGGIYDFNNQEISFDYGHGIMQLTPSGVWAHEPDNWSLNGEEVPTPGSHLVIPPCAMVATSTYTRCYTNSGTHSTSSKEYKDYGDTQSSTTYKLYSNTPQSIYSNIKDGLSHLRNKFNFSNSAPGTSTASSTIFQPYEREWFRATWGYNGFVTSTYLEDVATKMDSFSDYISSTGTRMVATSSFTVDLANKLKIADDYKSLVVVFSPVELLVTDSAGRTTGMFNGSIKEEIPESAYHPETKAVAIFFAKDSYTYTLRGIGNGTYGILIEYPDNGSRLQIYAPAVPVAVGEVHQYNVDWNAIRRAENGVLIKIDNEGNGSVDREVRTDASLAGVTLFTASGPILRQSSPPVPEKGQTFCLDGVDNDRDGATDLSDQDCKNYMPPMQSTPTYLPSIPVAPAPSSILSITSSTTN